MAVVSIAAPTNKRTFRLDTINIRHTDHEGGPFMSHFEIGPGQALDLARYLREVSK